MSSAPLIRFDSVAKIYGTGEAEVAALDGVDFDVDAGEFVAVMGPSGSGKSTAMNILGCLDTPSHGHYYFDGVDVAALTRSEKGAVIVAGDKTHAVAAEPIEARIRAARKDGKVGAGDTATMTAHAFEAGIITAEELALLQRRAALRDRP